MYRAYPAPPQSFSAPMTALEGSSTVARNAKTNSNHKNSGNSNSSHQMYKDQVIPGTVVQKSKDIPPSAVPPMRSFTASSTSSQGNANLNYSVHGNGKPLPLIGTATASLASSSNMNSPPRLVGRQSGVSLSPALRVPPPPGAGSGGGTTTTTTAAAMGGGGATAGAGTAAATAMTTKSVMTSSIPPGSLRMISPPRKNPMRPSAVQGVSRMAATIVVEDKIEARKKKLEALKAKSQSSSLLLARAKALTSVPPKVLDDGKKKVSEDVSVSKDVGTKDKGGRRVGVDVDVGVGVGVDEPEKQNVVGVVPPPPPPLPVSLPPATEAATTHSLGPGDSGQEHENLNEPENTTTNENVDVTVADHVPHVDEVAKGAAKSSIPPPPLPATVGTTGTVVPPMQPMELDSTKRLTLQALQQVATSPKRGNELENSHGECHEYGENEAGEEVFATQVAEEKIENHETIHGNKNQDDDDDDSPQPPSLENRKIMDETVTQQQDQVTNTMEKESSGVHSSTESSTLRLVRELRMAKQEKEQAMKRMAELESQVMELRFQVVQDTDGISSQNVERTGGRSFDRNGDMMNRTRSRRRMMKSPEPRRDRSEDPLQDISIASRAVETVEEVFESPLARFVVRKPYGGNETKVCTFGRDGENGEKSTVVENPVVEWIESIEGYLKNATVKDEKTLEVAAKVEADSSVLIVYGDSCCHGIPKVGNDGTFAGYDFKTFENIEYMEESLGKVIYIDSEGNDGEYWLDAIYEEALKIRESYCSNVFSAALALKAAEPATRSDVRPMNMLHGAFASDPIHHAQQPQKQHPFPPPDFTTMNVPPPSSTASSGGRMKPTMVDECVGTEDLSPVVSSTSTSTSDPSSSVETSKPCPSEPQKQSTQHQPKQQQQQQQQGFGSTDILSWLMVSLFSTIGSIVWFILMIPVRVTQVTFTICIMVAAVNFLWLYVADTKIAMDMGAMIDKQYNIH